MHLGSIYLVANDFRKSIAFYEQLLEIPVTSENKDRFAQFVFENHNISIMNGHFDHNYPDKIVNKGNNPDFVNDLHNRALAPNTQKFVFNVLHVACVLATVQLSQKLLFFCLGFFF